MQGLHDSEVSVPPGGISGRSAAGAGPHRIAISAGARTPEELETLFEDALVVREPGRLGDLFEDGAMLVNGDDRPARGGADIARVALATWDGEQPYLADPRRVLQARNVALVVTDHGVNVAQRGRDGTWRFAIVHLFLDDGDGKAQGSTCPRT